MACIPCSANTFRPPGTVGEEGCFKCPENETTHGRINSTRCSCIPGYVRGYQQQCVPCTAGTYCVPCFEGQTDCPQEGVKSTPCFPNSSSPPGSTSIQNCTCLSGLVALSTASHHNYYCAPVPPTAIYDVNKKRAACKRGWTEQWSQQGQLIGCTLCPMGFFAESDPSLLLQSSPTNVNCKPCPKGSFAASTDVIGNCTQCSAPQTTSGEASTSPEHCGCPLPTIKGPGGNCIGCLLNQYLLLGACVNCPAFSISSVGATSPSECKCMPGYGKTSLGVCKICSVGQYSQHASDRDCKQCPKGSTTKSLGSKSILECGATSDLCLAGFTWRPNLGCALTSALAVQ